MSKKFDRDASELQSKTLWMLKNIGFSLSYIPITYYIPKAQILYFPLLSSEVICSLTREAKKPWSEIW